MRCRAVFPDSFIILALVRRLTQLILILGDKLLVQLGTANPGKTNEEKQQWNDGLRLVLKDLRQQDTKDPDIVAMEIAKYRRRFLQDNTRVLNL